MTQFEQEHSDTAASHDPQDQHLSLGRYLQRERQKRDISLEAISEATGIILQTLRAMEADDRSRLPADAFLRGFIKLYTKELGINPDFALDLFSRRYGHDSGRYNLEMLSNETLAEARTLVSWRKMMAIFILVIVLLFLYIAWQTYPVLQNAMILKRMQVASQCMDQQTFPEKKIAHDKLVGSGKQFPQHQDTLVSFTPAEDYSVPRSLPKES